jgi:uncharacterized protein DUF4242
MARIVIETNFEKPLTAAEIEGGRTKMKACIAERHGQWIRSYLSTDRRRLVCEYEAPDAESVREACRSAGIPFGEVWTAGAVVKIEDYPDFLQKRDAVRARLRGKSP